MSSIQPVYLSLYILGEMESEDRTEFSNTPRRLVETSGKILLRLKACDTQQRQQEVSVFMYLQFLYRCGETKSPATYVPQTGPC